MAPKRPLDTTHPSRRDQVPTEPRKRQKPDNLGSRSFKKANPVNGLKNRIRDIKRMLSKDEKLPGHIRIEKERELRSAEYEVERRQEADKRSKMISRYHKVRFFDRQKATKKLKQARKRLAALEKGDPAMEKAQHEVVEAEVNLNYSLYYPLDKPYSSLFPTSIAKEEDNADEKDNTQQVKGDMAMRELVAQCMADNRLNDLREGKLTAKANTKGRTKSAAPKKDTATAAVKKDDNDNANNSDGEFFE